MSISDVTFLNNVKQVTIDSYKIVQFSIQKENDQAVRLWSKEHQK